MTTPCSRVRSQMMRRVLTMPAIPATKNTTWVDIAMRKSVSV